MLLIGFAVVFLIILFLLKNGLLFKKEENKVNQQEGLTYVNTTIGELVNKDTDLDGVLDWEESLWGTDPTKKDTDGNGVNDNQEIAELKKQTITDGQTGSETNKEVKLTETDKFSQELFSTIAVLNESGTLDEATVDKITTSLAEHIQNSLPRKVFVLSDVKIIQNNNIETIKNYDNALNNIYKKYPVKGNTMEILQRFLIDEENVDASVLVELDPIINQTNIIIDALIKISVPQSLASLHLEFVNGLERLIENLNDIQFYDTDVIVALTGISQYEQNTVTLKIVNDNLANAIKQKLNN